MILLIVLMVLAAATYGAWRWAVAQGSAATLEWIDARFSRERPVRMVAHGDYGANDHQNVELWTPQGQAPAGGWPLVVFVYGGGWHDGSTPEYRFVARTLGEYGAVIIVSSNLPGKSQTLTLLVSDRYNRGAEYGAYALSTLLMGVAVAALIVQVILDVRRARANKVV